MDVKERDGNRFYYFSEDEPLPSVTTVIRHVWPSEQLEKWRVKNIARFLVKESGFFEEWFCRVNKRPEPLKQSSAKTLGERMWDNRDDFTAAERGTRIHEATEKRIRDGKKSDWSKQLSTEESEVTKRIVRSLKTFEVLELEVAVRGVDPIPFAGRIDILAADENDKICLIDIKTGKRFNRSYIPQLGAYSLALQFERNGNLHPLYKIDRLLVLHATKESVSFLEVDIPLAHDLWRCCATVFSASQKTGGVTKIPSKKGK